MSIEHEHLYLVDERKPERNNSVSQCLFSNEPHIVSAKCLKLIPFLSLQCCSRTMRKQLDKNLSFHKLVAYMIALMTGELKGELSRLWRNKHECKNNRQSGIFSIKDADSHAFKTLVCLPCSSSFFQPVHPAVE